MLKHVQEFLSLELSYHFVKKACSWDIIMWNLKLLPIFPMSGGQIKHFLF